MRLTAVAIIATTLIVTLVPTHVASARSYCVTNGPYQELSSKCCDSFGVIPIVAPDGSTFYVDARNDPTAGPVWIYEETNGVTGLQRGGFARVTGEHDVAVPGKSTGPISVQPQEVKPVRTPASPATPVLDVQPFWVGPVYVPVSEHVPSQQVPSQSTPDVIVPISVYEPGVTTPYVYVASVGAWDGCYDTQPFFYTTDMNVI